MTMTAAKRMSGGNSKLQLLFLSACGRRPRGGRDDNDDLLLLQQQLLLLRFVLFCFACTTAQERPIA